MLSFIIRYEYSSAYGVLFSKYAHLKSRVILSIVISYNCFVTNESMCIIDFTPYLVLIRD